MVARIHIAAGLAAALSLPQFSVAQSAPFALPEALPGIKVPAVDVPVHVVRSSAASAEKPANRRIINTTSAQIEYRIDSYGPSGIGRVAIYLTADNGATWFKAGEDADRQSPATVDFPGEGVFGVRLAISNGNGFGGLAPRPGERPQTVVEVDATSPSVVLNSPETVPSAAAIDIRWTANDSNLTPLPVSLYFRTSDGTGWQSIAQSIKNSGVHRWPLPQTLGSRVELKVEVVDAAGNVTRVESPAPILLDQTEPEATVIDATPISRPGAPVLIPVSAASAPTPAEPPVAMPVAILPPNVPASLPNLAPLPR